MILRSGHFHIFDETSARVGQIGGHAKSSCARSRHSWAWKKLTESTDPQISNQARTRAYLAPAPARRRSAMLWVFQRWLFACPPPCYVSPFLCCRRTLAGAYCSKLPVPFTSAASHRYRRPKHLFEYRTVLDWLALFRRTASKKDPAINTPENTSNHWSFTIAECPSKLTVH